MDLRTIVILTVVMISMIAFNEVCARPSITDSWHHNRLDTRNINECDSPSSGPNEARELCQRCAKVTKSRLAYPLCCERREHAREWCTKFLNFGISPNNSGS